MTDNYIPHITSQITPSDIFGGWKARWGINRMDYKVSPGLYKIGNPNSHSPVLVTANYKLTFDALRKKLDDFDGWILVLDTKGINVWCAAGKGTFGTKELINRIKKTELHKYVAHRNLILPQLGAPGVSAQVVIINTGFKIIYGPVRAEDIKEFIRLEMRATPEMRTVNFTTYDRLVLTPMELIGSLKISMIVFGVLFLLNLMVANPFGQIDFYAYIGALLVGTVVTPVLLPWIPGKAFAWKGWLLGLIWGITLNLMNGWLVSPSYSMVRAIGYILVLSSVASFYAMNFTGASTYTSFSGVLKEMKFAVPAIIISISVGILLILLNSFLTI